MKSILSSAVVGASRRLARVCQRHDRRTSRRLVPTGSALGTRWQRADGSALMSAALAAGVLGIMVVSYLTWVTNEYRLSKRSHAWAQALSLCEAGAELALAEFNYFYINDQTSAFKGSRGWFSPNSTSAASKTVTGLTDARGQVVGDVTINVANIPSKYPTIQCTATVNVGSGNPVRRTLLVTTKRNRSFRYAFQAKQWIRLKTNGSIVVDSFDSTNPAQSTGRQYDPAKRTPRANIACLSVAADGIDMKNAHVYGAAATGPGGGVAMVGASLGATAVSAERSTSQADGETRGWISHDFITTFQDVLVPFDLSTAPNLGNVSGGITLNSGDYRMSRLRNTSGNILIRGDVRIYVQGDVVFAGSATLDIAPGASLEVYVTGAVTVGGGGIVNRAGVAIDNLWFGTATSTAWSLGGNGDFIGCIYAPSATLALGGNPDFMGAFVGNRIETTGDAKMHYDEALGRGINQGPYIVLSWQPLVNRAGAWVMETN